MPPALLLAVALAVSGPPVDNFIVQAELQGLYDETSQATLQFVTASDIDEFHAVLCTADWVFTDLAGHRRPWAEMRQDAVRALSEPRLDSMTQTIVKLSVDSGASRSSSTSAPSAPLSIMRDGTGGRTPPTR